MHIVFGCSSSVRYQLLGDMPYLIAYLISFGFILTSVLVGHYFALDFALFFGVALAFAQVLLRHILYVASLTESDE